MGFLDRLAQTVVRICVLKKYGPSSEMVVCLNICWCCKGFGFLNNLVSRYILDSSVVELLNSRTKF